MSSQSQTILFSETVTIEYINQVTVPLYDCEMLEKKGPPKGRIPLAMADPFSVKIVRLCRVIDEQRTMQCQSNRENI